MATPEGKVKSKIKKWLDDKGIKTWPITPSAYGNSTGVSDRIGLLKNGKFLAIEAKAEGKRDNVSTNQQDFIDTVRANNGMAFVVSCEADITEMEVSLRSKGLI